MSFPFVGKVVEARYTDPELKSVMVTYKEGDKIIPFNMTTESNDPRWVALQEDIGIEEVDRMTREAHEIHRNEFRKAFEDYAARGGVVERDDNVFIARFANTVINFDSENQQHTETLFKLKIALFDTDRVKNSEDQEKRTDLRSADNIHKAITAALAFPIQIANNDVTTL